MSHNDQGRVQQESHSAENNVPSPQENDSASAVGSAYQASSAATEGAPDEQLTAPAEGASDEQPTAPYVQPDLHASISPDPQLAEAALHLAVGELPVGTLLANRYQIQGLLGKGGFGEAYLADDIQLERQCVVKRVAPNPRWSEQKRTIALNNFRREAKLLVSLNSPGHPNIPEIYEYLDDDYCLVMKYIAGRDFWKVLVQHGGSLPAADALRYATDICSALAYMHARAPEPVLHRDIKPSNILIDSEQRVWVIDFGLARAIARAIVLEREEEPDQGQTSQGLGTYGYTPQEQWHAASEPRSDVYALTATLYEFLTGRKPDGKQRDLLQQTSGSDQSPLRHLHPAIRDEVEALLLRGLTDQVDERPTSQELLNHLRTIQKRLTPIAPPAPTAPPDTAGFVGREAELIRFIDDIQQQHVALITGMAGVGKTALAARLIARLAKQQMVLPQRIFWHPFYERDGVAGLVRNLAAFLAYYGQPDGWMMWNSFQQSDDPKRLLEIFNYLIHQIASQGGYLLCLDDLWHVESDPLLEDIGRRLSQEAQNGRFALIIVSRTMPSFVPGVVDPLNGLSVADTGTLLKTRDLNLRDDLVAQLQERTDGNAELLILAMDILQRAHRPERQIARLSETIDIQNYLLVEVDKSLDDRERAMMQAIAVLMGYPGTRNAIIAVAGTPKGLSRTLNALSERYLLVTTTSDDYEEYRQHAIIQEFYYRLLEEDDDEDALVEMHQRAGNYYEAEADDHERDVLKAAMHFERADDSTHAAELVTEDRTSVLINQGRSRMLRLLLGALTKKKLDTMTRVNVAIALGDTCSSLRELDDAEQSYLQAFELLAKIGDAEVARERKARICHGLGNLLSWDQPRKALEWVEQGLQSLAGTGTAAEGRLWLGKGSALMFIGEDLPAAQQALTQALDCLPEEASELRIRCLINLGIISCSQGDAEAGKRFYAEALKLCDQTGNDLDKAVITTNLAIEFWLAGDWDAAIAESRKALVLTEAVGYIEGQATLALNMGIIYTNQGDLQAARTSLVESVELLRRYNVIRYLIDALASLATLHIRSEQWDEAAACLTSAEQYIQDLDAPCALSEIQRGWAQIALARGELEQAHTSAQQAVQHGRSQDPREEGMSLDVLGTCLAAIGDYDHAIEALQQSLDVLGTSYPYEAARSQLDLARILLRAGEDACASSELQPDTLLEQARATFEHLGAQLDLAAVDQVR